MRIADNTTNSLFEWLVTSDPIFYRRRLHQRVVTNTLRTFSPASSGEKLDHRSSQNSNQHLRSSFPDEAEPSSIRREPVKGTKMCKHCRVEKQKSDFYAKGVTRSDSVCCVCRRASRNERYKKLKVQNPDDAVEDLPGIQTDQTPIAAQASKLEKELGDADFRNVVELFQRLRRWRDGG